MTEPIAVLDVDLTERTGDIAVPGAYRRALVLVRYHQRPMCRVFMHVSNNLISRNALWLEVHQVVAGKLQSAVLRTLLALPDQNGEHPLPTCSIIIATRDRSDDLQRCLESLVPQLSEGVELIVADNRPSDERTREVVARYPQVRYCRELRSGKLWAISRGISIAKGEILLLTDDDVVVDPRWVHELRAQFTDPSIGVVTGPVMPFELEHPAQQMFEEYGGFNCVFERRVFSKANLRPLAAGNVGVGANMAVRRSAATELGFFAVELDGGTPTKSGGDTYAIYRLLRAGYLAVYTPNAVVWHRHRRTEAELRRVLYGYGVGVYAFFFSCLFRSKDPFAAVAACAWFFQYYCRELLNAVVGKRGAKRLPLIWAETRGVFAAPRAYFQAWTTERRLGTALFD